MTLNADRRLSYQSACWRLVSLLLASLLLGSCATSPTHFGTPPRGDLRFDTETVARARYAGLLSTTGTSAAQVTLASTLVRLVPALLVVLHSDNKVNELQGRLQECARRAERQVNAPLFGDRDPTREECGEELVVDGCSDPITRAMLLGRQKHDLALACAREVLTALWPAPFSIEQRYRFYEASGILETISREKEQQIIKDRCTWELWGTIKPDLVLHADYNLLQAVLVLDFKFPCPPSNPPTWTRYGAKSPYADSNQGEVYEKALGGKTLMLTPRGIFGQ